MKVAFNPVISYNKPQTFGTLYYAHSQIPKEPTKNDIVNAKVKKVVSELKYIAFGVVILYFGLKKAIRKTELAQAAKTAQKLKADIAPPIIEIKPGF